MDCTGDLNIPSGLEGYGDRRARVLGAEIEIIARGRRHNVVSNIIVIHINKRLADLYGYLGLRKRFSLLTDNVFGRERADHSAETECQPHQ